MSFDLTISRKAIAEKLVMTNSCRNLSRNCLGQEIQKSKKPSFETGI